MSVRCSIYPELLGTGFGFSTFQLGGYGGVMGPLPPRRGGSLSVGVEKWMKG